MKEYTIFSIISIFIIIFIDKITRVNILRRGEFYIFLLVIIFFKSLVNGYLTGCNIVIYNPKFFSGIRLGSIPLEDFLFGFSMVSLTVIFWEYFLSKDV